MSAVTEPTANARPAGDSRGLRAPAEARPAPRAYSEPDEREDPRNALIDAAEELIRRCLDHGLGPQIEARLDRLIPKPAPLPPPRADAEWASEASGGQDLWEAAVILTALRECRRKIKSPASVQQIETALAFATKQFETARAARAETKG